jgi:fructosamine-3-kinase
VSPAGPAGSADRRLLDAVARRIAEATGEPAEVSRATPVGGGCIHHARLLELADGRRFFLKAPPLRISSGAGAAPPDLFEREAEGLAALAAAGAIRVPRSPLPGGGGEGVPLFLVMEAIAGGVPGPGFQERFGRRFARLHRVTAEDGDSGDGGRGRFGFDHDNYLGSTPQPNGWSDDWVDFFRRRRLGHQLDLARRNGLSDPELERLGDRLLDRLEEWLEVPGEPPCLLHGDLWGGNYLADEAGEPVLIDPAAYRGHREADLAMTRLFGGFDRGFYAAYEEEWPLPPGSAERTAIYQLYHLLNHLNLFGRSYRDRCVGILRRLV